MSRIGHTTNRHPLCPSCGYDLIATVEANRRVCPECGYAFELSELVRDARPGDWTPARAIRSGARTLLVRSLLAAALWIGSMWLLIPLASANSAVRVLIILGAIVLGSIIGVIYSARLFESAGFDSPLLVVGACVCALVVVFGGLLLVEWIRPSLAPAARFFVTTIALVIANAWIIKSTLMDQ